MNIKEQIAEKQQDVIRDLAELVSYPTVSHPNEDGTPFGKANSACLHRALQIGENYGFKAVNLDDYCGYLEMGQGDKIIGVVAHLDVVPVSEDWATDPFEMTRIGDNFYGRGTTDDKGAAVCALTAMRLLKENNISLNKRIRLILGCAEETGSRCVRHYVEKEGRVDYGFTPDGNFPLVYGEKGMVSALFKGKSDKIADIKGGTVSNAVANKCTFTLNCEINEEKLDAYFKQSRIEYTYENNILTVIGRSAHASMPELGINAVSHGFEGLYKAGIDDELVTAYHNLIGLGYNGENLHVDFTDDYGNLTFNVGLAFKKEDEIICTIDIRFPVTMQQEDIMKPMRENGGKFIEIKGGADALFFPLDNPMIDALLRAYYKVKGDESEKPLVIGGGTYAKSMGNIVAFGCEVEGIDFHIHDDNEYVSLESLLFQIEAYYEALVNLQQI